MRNIIFFVPKTGIYRMNHDPAKYLLDALLDEKAIVIEQVGTFSLKYRPAQPDNTGQALLPPSYEIGFQTRRMQDDQVFSHYLEASMGISFLEAQTLYRLWCSGIYEALHANKKVAFPSIGDLKLKEGICIFEPYESMNMFDDAFGLEKVEFTDTSAKNEKAKAKKQSKKTTDSRKSHGYGVFLLLITLGLIGLLVVAWFNPFNQEVFRPFRARVLSLFPDKSISIEINAPASPQQPEALTDSATRTRNALFYEEQKPSSPENKPVKVTAPETKKSDGKPSDSKNVVEDKYAHCKDFYLIAGSFDTPERAATFVKKLSVRGQSSEVLQMQGKYRVSIGHFTKRPDALQKLEVLRKDPANKEVWLLSK